LQRIMLSLLFVLPTLLFALPALAGNWGTMTWGAAIAAVPTMGKLGLLVLVLGLGGLPARTIKRSRAAASLLVVGLVAPVLAAMAPGSAQADPVILSSGTCEESGYLSITTPAGCLAAGALTSPAINGGAASDQPPEGYGDTSEFRTAGCTVHDFELHAGGHTQFFPHATGACGASSFNCICLSGLGIKLEEGSIVPAAALVLANPSETLRLERGLLGQLGAGRSSGASGGVLTGGVLAVPEPGAVLFWAAGLLGLLALRRLRPVSVESELADIATQGEPS
jgi:hypothetical protein